MGSQHPSPNVKTFCNFEPQIWLEIITSRDAKSACFKGSRTSCREIIFGIFWPKFWPEKITSRDGCFLPIRFAIVAPSYRECRAQNAEKSLKKVVPGRQCQKSAEKVKKKSRESQEKVPKRDFFVTFSALRADRPGTTFLRLFRHFWARTARHSL